MLFFCLLLKRLIKSIRFDVSFIHCICITLIYGRLDCILTNTCLLFKSFVVILREKSVCKSLKAYLYYILLFKDCKWFVLICCYELRRLTCTYILPLLSSASSNCYLKCVRSFIWFPTLYHCIHEQMYTLTHYIIKNSVL
jgi:hypothetical protein